jgi:hypothetical protein
MLRETSGAGHKPWEVRARHSDYDATVLGDRVEAHEAVARGRLHSLASAAALADQLLAASVAGTAPSDGVVDARQPPSSSEAVTN